MVSKILAACAEKRRIRTPRRGGPSRSGLEHVNPFEAPQDGHRTPVTPLILGSLLISLCVSFGCRSREERVADHWERAEAHLEQSSWDAARIELLNVLELAPEDARAHFELSEALLELASDGRASANDALVQLREAVRLAPDQLEYRARLGLLALAARAVQVAEEQADFILERDPAHVDAWLLRAQLNALRRDPEGQLNALERALQLAPARASTHLLLAQAFERRGDQTQAEAHLRRLLELENTTASWLYWAAFLADRERQNEALSALEKAVELASDTRERLEARTRLANFHIALGHLDEAESTMLHALREQPDSLPLLSQLTRFYAVHGQGDRAEEMLRLQSTEDPERIEPYLGLAQLYARLGQQDRALRVLESASDRAPDDERPLLVRAEVLLGSDSEESAITSRSEAEALVRRVLERNPASPGGLFLEAKFLLARGAHRAAADRLERVVLAEASPAAHHLLGVIYVALGDDPRAREQFRQALQQDPQNLRSATALAELEVRARELDSAWKRSQLILKLAPGSPRARLVAAEILLLRGEQKPALEALRAVLTQEAATAVPEVREARVRAAVLLGLRGAPDDLQAAREVLQAELDRSPTSGSALRGWVELFSSSDRPAVEQRLARALEADPNFGPGYLLRATLHLGELRSDTAASHPSAKVAQIESDFSRALELCGEPREATESVAPGRACKPAEAFRSQLGLAKLYRATAQPERALSAYAAAEHMGMMTREASLERASYLEEIGRFEEASQAYEQAIDRDPRDDVALNNLAWRIADREPAEGADLERALSLARRAVDLSPDNAAFADTLGYVLLKQKKPLAAAAAFKDAIRNARSEATRAQMRFHLALAYELDGNLTDARAQLAEALESAAAFPSRSAALDLQTRLASKPR